MEKDSPVGILCVKNGHADYFPTGYPGYYDLQNPRKTSLTFKDISQMSDKEILNSVEKIRKQEYDSTLAGIQDEINELKTESPESPYINALQKFLENSNYEDYKKLFQSPVSAELIYDDKGNEIISERIYWGTSAEDTKEFELYDSIHLAQYYSGYSFRFNPYMKLETQKINKIDYNAIVNTYGDNYAYMLTKASQFDGNFGIDKEGTKNVRIVE